MSLTRRSLLRNSALVTAGIAVGTYARRVWASIATTKHFVMTAPYALLPKPGTSPAAYWSQVTLHNTSSHQSFAFDNLNQLVYVLQPKSGGGANDLTVSQLDFAGNLLGYMNLIGFGHGVSFGVEPSGSVSYLWTECDADTTTNRGTNICRFSFVNASTLNTTSPTLTKYTMRSNSDSSCCTIDPGYTRLLFRHRDKTTLAVTYDVYDLSDVKTNGASATPLVANVAEFVPSGSTLQGYCLYGSFIYLLTGTPYSSCPPNTSENDMYIHSYNINTSVLGSYITTAGLSAYFREPQGMAIQIPDMSNPTAVRLCYGFAELKTCGGAKYCTIYYKDQLAL